VFVPHFVISGRILARRRYGKCFNYSECTIRIHPKQAGRRNYTKKDTFEYEKWKIVSAFLLIDTVNINTKLSSHR